jgi:hypothetical protein
MNYDDGIKNKSFEEMLNNPDLEDQMSQLYQKGRNYAGINQLNFDPGRIRYQPFFAKMYGATEEEIKKNLVEIRWLPGTVNKPLLVTRINGIAQKLTAISEELERLNPEMRKYVDNPAGTFAFRKINATERISTHSYGIAIDINVEFSNYWQWDKQISYKNKIPWEIVEIFEEYGFIWGGKWYHYDTMHFEYRPELLSDHLNIEH